MRGRKMKQKKNMRRISLLVTAQTAWHIQRLARIAGVDQGRVVDKLVRDRMVMLHEGEERAL